MESSSAWNDVTLATLSTTADPPPPMMGVCYVSWKPTRLVDFFRADGKPEEFRSAGGAVTFIFSNF